MPARPVLIGLLALWVLGAVLMASGHHSLGMVLVAKALVLFRVATLMHRRLGPLPARSR